MENETSEGFDLHAAADEIIASEGDSSQAQTDDSSLEEGQSLEDSQQSTEKTELSPEDILNQVGKEQADPNAHKDLLEKINALGAVHAGAPVMVDSPEKLKQLIEMGAGFYAKTEEHANKVKAWEADTQQRETQLKEREGQFAQQEEQFQRATLENQLMEEMLLEMQASDPEAFAYIASEYQKKVAAHERQRPVMTKYEGKLKSLEDEIKGLRGEKKNEELGQIKQGWEKELGTVQDKHAVSLSKLGIRPDWDKVKAHWAADASGTMTAEQALYAVHGPDISKAHQSQLKLLQTKNKVSEKLVHRSGVGGSQRGGEEDLSANEPGDYMSILRSASEKL